MTLEEVRKKIDKIDEKILLLLSQRVRLSHEAKSAKRREGKDMRDLLREKYVIEKATQSARLAGIDEDFIRKVYTCIIEESLKVQLE